MHLLTIFINVRVFNCFSDLFLATFTQPSPILRRWDRCLKREIEPNQWSHLVLLRLNCLRLGWFGCRVGRHRLIDHRQRLSSCVNLIFFLCPLFGPTYKFTRQKFTQPKICKFHLSRGHAKDRHSISPSIHFVGRHACAQYKANNLLYHPHVLKYQQNHYFQVVMHIPSWCIKNCNNRHHLMTMQSYTLISIEIASSRASAVSILHIVSTLGGSF